MSNYSKIYVTSTSHAPTSMTITDVPTSLNLIMPLRNFEITQFNTVSDYLLSLTFKQCLLNDWFIAYNEYGQNVDVFKDTSIDTLLATYTDGQVPTYSSSVLGFVPTTPTGGGGGSDNFLSYTLTAVTDVTILHSFARQANVKVFENNQEIEVLVSYPVGFTTSKVRIQSNQPVTGFAILT